MMSSKNKPYRLFMASLCLVVFIFSTLCYGSSATPLPTSSKYLNDYIGLLTETQTSQVLSLGKELEDKTGAQAVIAIIDSTDGLPIDQYALNLFRSWGIGEKGKDSGLLILLAVEDQSWRVEVGRGLEGAIPDLLSSHVMDSLAKPSFIASEYGQGLTSSYSVFCDAIAKEYGVTLSHSLNITAPTTTHDESPFNGGRIGALIVLLLLLDFIFNRGRFSSTFLQLIFWSNINRRNGPRGGSSGGGFGNFGGGSSNGGGSSGGW